MGISVPWVDSLDMIDLHQVKNARDEPNGIYFHLGRLTRYGFLEDSKKHCEV